MAVNETDQPVSQPAPASYEFGPFRVEAARRRVLREGEVVAVPAKAFELLLVLLRRHGQVLGKDELMDAVWPDTVVEENNLAVYMSVLRKLLGESKDEHRYIVPGC